MHFEELRRRHTARPFHPFTLFLNDGRAAVVDHPELMILPPDNDAFAYVYEVPGGLRIIDVPSITEIGFVDRRKNKPEPRKKRP